MAKKTTSFRLSEEALQIIKKMAELDDRSEANIIERIVKAEADRLKIKLDKK